MNNCHCGNNKKFAACCQAIVEGRAKAKTVKQLVRSRYTAYAIGGHGEYLIKSWHPSTVRNISIADLSIPKYKWLSLKIISYLQKGDFGKVEFKASFEDKGLEQIHHEQAVFHRLKGEWLYLKGNVVGEED